MSNIIAPEISTRIELTPDFIEKTRCLRATTIKRANILAALKVMEGGKSIVYTVEEFLKEFGKSGVTSMKIYFKKNNLPKAHVAVANGKVYIFNRTKV